MKLISRKELAQSFGIHYSTLTRWLKKFGIVPLDDKGKGRRPLLTPPEVELFKQRIGSYDEVMRVRAKNQENRI